VDRPYPPIVVTSTRSRPTFTDELTGASGPAPLAQAVIALAATLGMDTAAERIEEAAQAERLRALGCRCGQGYHYSHPMPAEQMSEFLRQATPATGAGAAAKAVPADGLETVDTGYRT
jgi:EAL domain-containing protein (putative c-di-GMP-specific phosphodiesterase class I)